MYHIVEKQSPPPRLTLRRVIWVKFLRYVEGTKLPTLRKHFVRFSTFFLTVFAIAFPQLALGILYGTLSHYSAPLLRLSIIPIAYATYRLAKIYAKRRKRSGSNEHSYNGVSVDEFATFLIETGGFKFKDVQKRFGFSQDKYKKIGDQLEGHAVLVRDDNNARVLNTITREELVMQLRDNFPMVYSEHEKQWTPRRGTFDTWVLDRERREAKERERGEKKERKIKRLDKAIQKRHEALFTSRMLDYA